MPTPPNQSVIAPPSRAAVFLVLTLAEGSEQVVRDVLADMPALVRSVGFRVPEDELGCVVGIGSRAWDRLFGSPRPAELHPFVPLRGARHVAPATDGDLLLHVRARHEGTCFELAGLITRRLGGAATVVDETRGFTSFDRRNVLGFADGTENPTGTGAERTVFVGEEDPAFAGGSYVVVQKYLHDIDAWSALPVEEQQRVIGRTKTEDVELSEKDQPADSHVAVNQVEDADGEELEIVRLNLSFGSLAAREFGTYFIGYCRTPSIVEQMLRNMFLGTPDAAYDRLLDFSTAVTGSLFYVPTPAFLEACGGPQGGDS
ncbi:Dyp-type peroxidase [Streptomyces sp. RerS4]|uniref:Dyp-type peroxidase n=1 Tax=Streptomyces sp. RerS4 TaxID=2942449 RepID=UPI00201BF59A|nr:Dyp-type peroxidase [Streptomyces sp. RerS4]UQW99525.1 Dyp-type peroxidase [Streptomyces sp. RerS4]